MKLKTVLYLAILFLMVLESQAQPGCRGKFSPYNICISDYEKSDYIFYGEIISSGKRYHDLSINRKSAYYGTTVTVKRTFKGNPPKQFEIFLDYDITCDHLPEVGSRYIFDVKQTTENGRKIYYSDSMSRPVTDYSQEALKEVFSQIYSLLKNKKENIIEGAVVESPSKLEEVNLKNEMVDRYNFGYGLYAPLPGIIVKATNLQTQKEYITKSRSDGSFRFENMPPGGYSLQALLDDGRQGRMGLTTDGTLCKRRQYIVIQPGNN